MKGRSKKQYNATRVFNCNCLRNSFSGYFHPGLPWSSAPTAGCFHWFDPAVAREVELLFIFTHVPPANFHSFQVNRFIFEVGISDFTLFAAGMGKPSVTQVYPNVSDALASSVL